MAAGTGSGPITDYAINPFLNDPSGSIAGANVHRLLSTISDGTSNTILLGHAYLAMADYTLTTCDATVRMPFFAGGTLSTARNGEGDSNTTWLRDGSAATSNQWGSPMAEGGLMAMADGAVRLFPYATPLTHFLLPDDGNAVELPD